MADYILASNRQSALYLGLKQNQEDISYDIPKSIVGAVKTIDKILPNVTTIVAPQTNQSEVIFNIPQGAWLDNMLVQHVMTFVSAPAVNRQIGKTILAEVELSSNNKPLFRCSASALIARVADSDPARAAVYERVCGSLNSTTHAALATADSATAVTTFTPILIPFSESIRLALDTGFNEPLTLKIRYATQVAAGMDQPIATVSPVLWAYKHVFDADTQDKMRASHTKKSGLFNQLLTNTFTEIVECSHVTKNTVRLNCNYPVQKLHFFIKPKTTAWIAASSEVVLFNIDSFQFQVAGRDVFSSGEIPSIVNQYESALSTGRFGLSTGTTAGVRAESLNKVITLNFGLLKDNRYMVSGITSFLNLNNPTLVINTQTLTTASNYEVHVVYEYANIVSTDSRGVSSVTVAS